MKAETTGRLNNSIKFPRIAQYSYLCEKGIGYFVEKVWERLYYGE